MQDPLTQEQLKEAVNTSSGINRTLGITFVLFLFYVLVSVASTTDLTLFLPASIINLPIINLDLSLKLYYVLAPLLILVFHFNLLTNLEKHAQKLSAYYTSNYSNSSQGLTIYPFLFNYASRYSPYTGQSVLRGLVRFSIFTLPLVILVFIQFRFADYHSPVLTTFHFILVLLDAILISRQTEQIKSVLRRGANTIRTHLSDLFSSTLRGGLVAVSFFLFLIFYATVSNVIMADAFQRFQLLIPNIDLTGQSLVQQGADDRFVDLYVENREVQNIDEIIEELQIKFTSGYDLSGRDLSYAVLSSTIMTNIKLDNSNLRFANLTDANLQGGSLINCNLSDTNLTSASLAKTNLMKADLSGAFMYRTDLAAAFLRDTDCRGAYIRGVTASGANFEDADLTGVSIVSSNFSDSNLRSAAFTGAHLTDLQLEGSLVIYADFVAADISKTSFSALDLEGVNFQGARFGESVSFDFSYLRDTHFSSSSSSSSTILSHTNYHSVNDLSQLSNPTNLPGIFSSPKPVFQNTIKQIAEDMNVPQGEELLRGAFLSRMKSTSRLRAGRQATPSGSDTWSDLAHLNALRRQHITSPSDIRGVVIKQLHSSTGDNYPECVAMLSHFQNTSAAVIQKIKASVAEELSFKEKCEFAAREYVLEVE